MKFDRANLTDDGEWVIGYMTQFAPHEEFAVQLQFDTDVGNVLRWCTDNVLETYIPMTQRNSVRLPRMNADNCSFTEYEHGKMLIMTLQFTSKKDVDRFQKNWC